LWGGQFCPQPALKFLHLLELELEGGL
jgi:hypothetical protein